MNILLVAVGKTDMAEIRSLIEKYAARIGHYARFEVVELPDVRRRNVSEQGQRSAESEALLKLLTAGDYVVLLDERGKELRSTELAEWLSKRMLSGVKRLVFVIGGPYGFAQSLYDRSEEMLSLSRMTFSHQMVRAIFAEQLYRAFSILNNEPYHHE